MTVCAVHEATVCVVRAAECDASRACLLYVPLVAASAREARLRLLQRVLHTAMASFVWLNYGTKMAAMVLRRLVMFYELIVIEKSGNDL